MLTALFSGFSSRIAVSIYRSRTADYLVGIVVRTVACQLAYRANASKQTRGLVSASRGGKNALDGFCNFVASLAVGLGISRCRKFDSPDPGNRSDRIVG